MDGKRLAQLREAAGMTQIELAAATKLSVTTISDIERGAPVNPRYSTLEVLARALNCTVADLLADPADPKVATG